jgi:hypothetical protein
MYAQAVVPTVPAGLPSALLERRPDLRQAEQQLVGANARIGVAQAEFFPKLSLTALLGTASPEVSALTGGSATIWAVAGMADRSSTRAAPSATTGRPSRSGRRRSSNTSRRCSPRSGRSRMLTLLVKLTRRCVTSSRRVRAVVGSPLFRLLTGHARRDFWQDPESCRCDPITTRSRRLHTYRVGGGRVPRRGDWLARRGDCGRPSSIPAPRQCARRRRPRQQPPRPPQDLQVLDCRRTAQVS